MAPPTDAGRTVAEALNRWGRLDALINNAGAGAILPLAEATVERITDTLSVNVIGPSLLASTALPHLEKTRGAIVNVSSTFGHKPGAALSHYAASKAALEHLTRCWALELASVGIRVNAVATGPTESGALTGMMGLSLEQTAALKEQERAQIPLGRRGIAIGGGDIAPAPPRLKAMFAHQAPDFLVVHDKPAVPQRCLHPAAAIGLETVGDRRHRLDERRVVDADGRPVIIGRARDPHQPAPFCDGDAAGPVTTDVVALLGRGPCFRAPFRNSISRACLPTSRSSAAMRAS